MKFICPGIKIYRGNLMTWRVGYLSQIFRDRLRFIHQLQHGSIFDSALLKCLWRISQIVRAPFSKFLFQFLLFTAIDIFVFCFFIDYFNVRVLGVKHIFSKMQSVQVSETQNNWWSTHAKFPDNLCWSIMLKHIHYCNPDGNLNLNKSYKPSWRLRHAC